jgi:hypothetical protein
LTNYFALLYRHRMIYDDVFKVQRLLAQAASRLKDE